MSTYVLLTFLDQDLSNILDTFSINCWCRIVCGEIVEVKLAFIVRWVWLPLAIEIFLASCNTVTFGGFETIVFDDINTLEADLISVLIAGFWISANTGTFSRRGDLRK